MEPEKSFDLSNLTDDQLRKWAKLIDIKNTRVEFVTKYHRNTSGDRMEFTRFRHMLALYNTVASKVVIMGGSQIGKTDWLVIDTLAAAYNNVAVFYVLPKVDFLKSYVKEKVKNPINRSLEYKAILKDSTSEAIELLQFGKSFIKFVGANVASDFVGFAGGQYNIDEIDQCESEDNLELGYSRISGSIYKFERMVSNPTTTNGRIFREYQKSDQRVWMCPCTKCGKMAELDWFKSVVKEVEDDSGNVVSHVLRDKDWYQGCGRDIYIMCPQEGCDGHIDRFHQSCSWVAKNPESAVEGYHMPSLISPLNSVSDGWARYRDGLNNPSKMSSFYSMFLALPYAPVGSKVGVGLLERCASTQGKLQYTVKIMPNHATVWEETHPGPCSMGVDTSPGHIDIRISCNEGGKRKMIYVGKLNAREVSAESLEASLHLLIEQYNVQCCVIDIGPEKLLAMDFQANAKCPVWLCKFLGRGDERLMKYNYTDAIISIDRTEALDRAYAQLKTGKNLIPINYRHILDGAYVSEMTSLVREVSEDSKGNLKYSWTKGTDHAFLADTYDILAFDIIQEDVLSGNETIFIG